MLHVCGVLCVFFGGLTVAADLVSIFVLLPVNHRINFVSGILLITVGLIALRLAPPKDEKP